MNDRNPFWSRKNDSPYFIKEDQGGWRVCKRGRSGEVYDVARRWFGEKRDAERVRKDLSFHRTYRNPAKRIGDSEAPYAIILSDYDDKRLARAYGNVRPSHLDKALRDVDRFYRRWKKDPGYELSETGKARSRLLSQLQALGQGELKVNPITRLDRMQMEPHMFGLPRQHKYPMYVRGPAGRFVFSPEHAALAKAYAEDEHERGTLSAAQLGMVRDRANRLLRKHR